MPNISFDIFFNDDVINLTASRSQGAPKVKPAWKVRSAPKLPPKEPPALATAVFAPKSKAQTAKPKSLTESKTPSDSQASPKLNNKVSDSTQGTKSASEPKKIPKLKDLPKST